MAHTPWTHPDDTLTGRGAVLRMSLADALFLVRRARSLFRNGAADALPLTDEDRNNLADAIDALESLQRALNRNVHPTAYLASKEDL